MSDIIARSFELVRSGECRSVEELKSRLKRDRYSSVDEHLAGPRIRQQLNTLIAEKRRSMKTD